MTQPVDPTAPGADGGDAYAVLAQMLSEWGLESLLPDLQRMITEGYSQDQLSYQLQQTDAYKKRFAANDARRKKGLPVLAPREYIEVERSYRQIMSSAGLPAGFYDQPQDFEKWIENDVAPTELSDRVGLVVDKVNRLSDSDKRYALEAFGLADQDLYAYFLDPDRARPLLEKTARGVAVAGAAHKQGLSTTADRARQLGESLQAENAEFLYGQVADMTREGDRLSRIYGGDYGQADAEDEAFFGTASSRRKRRKLAAKEEASFSGSGGVGRGSLSRPASY